MLFLVGAMLFIVLGVAHGWLTFRDLRTPRSFVPTDEGVRIAMAHTPLRLAPQTTIWRSWVGFNFSHSLGLAVFGGLLAGLALRDFDVVARSAFLQASSVIVAVLYLWMAVRYWFWLPAAVLGIGAVCFVVSAFTS
jgi:hypothetical protein